MRKLKNIRLKDINKARAMSIFAFKKGFGISLIEAKELSKRMLESGSVEATYLGYQWGSHSYEYNFHNLNHYTTEHFEGIIKEAFDFDLEWDGRPSNENMREPCEDTKKALAWLETLTEEQKDWVKLIGDWEHPVSFYAAVC